MTKQEIEQRLYDVMKMTDSDNQTGGYLEYDIRAMELYIHHKVGRKSFVIKKTQSLAPPIQRPELEDNSAIIFYPTASEHFDNRVFLAIGLGVIAYNYIPDNPFGDDIGIGLDIKRIIYFAQKLLQKRTSPPPASVPFGDEYFLPSEKIPERLKELFDYKPSDLPPETKGKIDALIEDIHSEMPDRGLLDHDSKLISLYAAERDGTALQIFRRSSDRVPRNKCAMLCFSNKVSIAYPKESNPLEQRILVGHELGNLVCHWKPGIDGEFIETQEERKEATYFSKILLEHRAAQSLGKEHPKYQESREMIAQTIKRIYSGALWLKWIFEDERP